MADSESPAEARKSEGGPPRLARSAGVFGLATFASRILGVARDQVISYYFGAETTADRKSTRLNSSHQSVSRMPSSA